MTNSSQTGGYLRPIPSSPAPLERKALGKVFVDLVDGLTGIDRDLIRVTWPGEQTTIPKIGDTWCGIAISPREIGAPQFTPQPDGDGGLGTVRLTYDQTLEVRFQFFDAGQDGGALELANLFQAGLMIQQNLEPLLAQGMAWAWPNVDLVQIPAVLMERWKIQVDVPLTVRRQVDRDYPIRNIVAQPIRIRPDPGGVNKGDSDFVVTKPAGD